MVKPYPLGKWMSFFWSLPSIVVDAIRVKPMKEKTMLTKSMLHILNLALQGQLPRLVDDETDGIDMGAFKELWGAGMISAVDASADSGNAFLHPSITFYGRILLENYSETDSPR